MRDIRSERTERAIQALARVWIGRTHPIYRALLPREGWELTILGGEPVLKVRVPGGTAYLTETGLVNIHTAEYTVSGDLQVTLFEEVVEA